MKDSKTHKALLFITKKGTARSAEIAEHIGCVASSVNGLLAPYVDGGLLVVCEIDKPGQKRCNEYRISAAAGDVKPESFRDFRISKKPSTPPAPKPAVQPQVTDNNSGSTPAGDSFPPPAGRAVTKKPARTAPPLAAGAGGHVPAPITKEAPRFGYFDDGSVEIIDHGIVTTLEAADAKRLADFLMNCLISREVNA